MVYIPKVLVAQDLKKGDLVEVLTDYVEKSLGIYAVYPYTKQQPMKVKLFIEHIYQYYQKYRDTFK
ncbi:putative transcriptional regulator, LysR family protein [Photobacterium sp. SKA34]|nr:putative transcriptional regulator, LysR family protein [Photobacterium sp. SKA34]